MRVIGGGLIARSFARLAGGHDRVIVFASGVSDSSCTNEADFARERQLLLGTLEEARSRGERLVYFSGGGALYGRWDRPAVETGPVEPQTAYGRHQRDCEVIVAAAAGPHFIVRLPNVVGSSANRSQLVPSLVAQVRVGRVSVHGRATRDLVDADDMAGIVSELLDKVAQRDLVNVASGRAVPVSAIVGEIASILAVDPVIEVSDRGEPQRFDITRLTELLGRDPFPEDHYYQRVLRQHVPRLAEEIARAGV